MNKNGQIGLGEIVMLFVGIVFALALFSPILDTVGGMNNKQVQTNQSVSTVTGSIDGNNVNETFNYSIYTQSNWKTLSCALGSVAVRNGVGTALVVSVDYTLDAANGRYSLLNTTKTIPDTALNLTYADYTYCLDGYNKDAGARGMNNLILIMTTLILLGFVLEKSGVTNWSDKFS